MNYRHAFHAGNPADVFKHWVLTLILEKLCQKETPFGVLDTHAGEGFYDLSEAPAERTLEYRTGIEKLRHSPQPPSAFLPYLNAVKKGEENNTLRFYPGSSGLIAHYLRPDDHLIACEKHALTYEKLRHNLVMHREKDYPLSLHCQDAYLGLKAFLPLKEKRGLVLIDPPFETKDEFDQILAHLPMSLKRFSQGIFMIWYPIKHRSPIQRFHEKLFKSCEQPILIAEVLQREDNKADQLNGSGLAIINPPYPLEETLRNNLPWLANCLALGSGARSDLFTSLPLFPKRQRRL